MNPADPNPRATPAELARARDRLEAFGSLAGIVVHRGRNRLSTLRAALELIEAGLEANLSAEYRSTLLRELDAFIAEFNFGADLLRWEGPAPAAVSLQEVVEEAAAVFRPHAARAGVALACACGHACDRAVSDRRLLRLALLQVLRHCGEGLAGRAGRIELRTAGDAAEWRIDVADDGPGVPGHLHDRLWEEPSPEAKGSGSGFGLVLCRDALRLLGGSAAYLTPRGRPGAHFRLSVPLVP